MSPRTRVLNLAAGLAVLVATAPAAQALDGRSLKFCEASCKGVWFRDMCLEQCGEQQAQQQKKYRTPPITHVEEPLADRLFKSSVSSGGEGGGGGRGK
jgi:hypothetical protein